MHAAVAGWLDLHAQGLASVAGLIGSRRTRACERLQPRVVYAGRIKLRQWIGDFLITHQRLHGLAGRHRSEAGDLKRRTAKAGALKQMGRTFGAPVARSDGLQVVLPMGGCGLRAQGDDAECDYGENLAITIRLGMACHGVSLQLIYFTSACSHGRSFLDFMHQTSL